MILYHFICSVPWNQSTISGYFCTMLFTTAIVVAFMVVHGLLLVLFISICIQHRAFYQIVQELIAQWNCHPKEYHSAHEFICRVIRFHISVKRLRHRQMH